MNKDIKAHENGLKALRLIEKFLNQVGWEPQNTDIEEVLLVDFEKENIPISSAHFDVRVNYERFLCYFNFSEKVPKAQMEKVMEFITLANFDLVIGNFELNLDTGLVRFKSSIDFTQVELNETLIRNTIKSGMDAVEQYAEALVSVIKDGRKVSTAIQEAEAGLPGDISKGKFSL